MGEWVKYHSYWDCLSTCHVQWRLLVWAVAWWKITNPTNFTSFSPPPCHIFSFPQEAAKGRGLTFHPFWKKLHNFTLPSKEPSFRLWTSYSSQTEISYLPPKTISWGKRGRLAKACDLVWLTMVYRKSALRWFFTLELSKVHFCRQSLHFAFCQLTSPPQPRHVMSFKGNFAKLHLGTEISRQEGASESFEAVGIVLLIDSNLQFLSLQTVGATTINVAPSLRLFFFLDCEGWTLNDHWATTPLVFSWAPSASPPRADVQRSFDHFKRIVGELSACDPLHCIELVKSEEAFSQLIT